LVWDSADSVLLLFGGADPGIPATDIATFAAALDDAGVDHHIETYPNTPHSFFDRSFKEHREACEDAWRRALAFMRTGSPSTGEARQAESRRAT